MEVLVDFTPEVPQMAMVFDRMLDCPETRAWALAAFNAASVQLSEERVKDEAHGAPGAV